LVDATIKVCEKTNLLPKNILLLGVDKQRRFIFMPLVDLF